MFDRLFDVRCRISVPIQRAEAARAPVSHTRSSHHCGDTRSTTHNTIYSSDNITAAPVTSKLKNCVFILKVLTVRECLIFFLRPVTISSIRKFLYQFPTFRLSGLFCSHEHGLDQRSYINALFMDVFLTGVCLYYNFNS